MISEKEAKKLAKKTLSNARYEHTLNVRRLAVMLAEKHGADREKAALAALLHDIAKEIPKDKLLQICLENDILKDSVQTRSCALWHGFAAAVLAQRKYGVEDTEILSAIACHTAGKQGMSKLDKIVYLADMASEERPYPEAEILRRHAMDDLDATMVEALALSIEWLRACGKTVDNDTLLAYEELRNMRYGGNHSHG